MNKKIISIICITLLFSILFYEQHVGVNFLLFTIATIGFFIFQDKNILKDKKVLILSFSALFAAFFAVIHGATLSFWSTFVALLVLPGAILNKHSNVLLDFSSSIVNIAVAPIFMVIEMIESGKKGKAKGFLQLLKYLVPLVFIIVFFFIYRAMNPLFEKLTQDIAALISIGWVLFTLLGFIISYAIYNQQRAKEIDTWERSWDLNIDKKNIKESKWNEGIAFILLFIVLNLMLISVNAMDINYLYLSKGMPEGITHKEFVHKGVGMLIFSILLGISLLLFFFRGALNFSANKTLIKLLGFLWVAQNMFMVVSTSLRNTMLVNGNECLLTYKRIGVYFWLFFALVGLITLFIKLKQNKTVWFLARHNFLALFIVLIASSAVDWDLLISNFNINRATQENEISSLDKKYLLSLSEGNIKSLYGIKNIEGFNIDSVYSYSFYNGYHSNNRNWLDYKVYNFLKEDAEGDWRSYSVRRNRVRKDIELLNTSGELESLDLRGDYRIKTIEPLISLTNLKILNLSECGIEDWENLQHFKVLETLSASYLTIDDIEHFKQLTTLKSLNIKNTNLQILKEFIKELPKVDVY